MNTDTGTGSSSRTDFIRDQSRENYRNLPSLWSWWWGGRDWWNFRSDDQMVNLIFWLNRSKVEGIKDDHFPFNNEFRTGQRISHGALTKLRSLFSFRRWVWPNGVKSRVSRRPRRKAMSFVPIEE
jgi:hypothetical protein